MVLASVSEPSIITSNADGATSLGRPFFNLIGQVPGDELDAGESTSNRPIIFSNPLLTPFSVTVELFREVPPPKQGDFFVSDDVNNSVVRYEALTGTFLGVFGDADSG